ncbi:hypothetical protein M513_05896, partial [Trichuris suis]
GWSKSVLL